MPQKLRTAHTPRTPRPALSVLGIVLPRALSASQQAGMHDRIGLPLGGLHLSQVAIGVLGVLVITSEYSSGMIRASLAAVPQRRLLLAAKTAVLAAIATAAGLAACYGAYFAFQVSLPPGSPLRVPLSDPGVVRAVTGAGLYLAVLALAGLGLGAILRSSAKAPSAPIWSPDLRPARSQRPRARSSINNRSSSCTSMTPGPDPARFSLLPASVWRKSFPWSHASRRGACASGQRHWPTAWIAPNNVQACSSLPGMLTPAEVPTPSTAQWLSRPPPRIAGLAV